MGTKKESRRRGVIVEAETREALQALIGHIGWARAMVLLGLSQHAIERAMRGQSVIASSAVTIRVALALASAHHPAPTTDGASPSEPQS